MKRIFLFALALLTLLSTQAAHAQVPRTISYQGQIQSSNGALASSAQELTVRLYSDPDGKNMVWQDTFTATLQNGIFNLLLGSQKPLPSAQAMNAPLWLAVQIGEGEELKPLSPLSSSPYAMNVADSSITAKKIAADYVGSISVNGTKVTGNGTNVNLMAGDGLALDYDPSSNAILLSETGGGNGAKTLSSDNYIINETTQESGANFNISGSGVIGTNLTVGGAVTFQNLTSGSSDTNVLVSSGGVLQTRSISSLGTSGVTSITGTANQVIASSPTGNVTLSLPQNINTGATPQFADVTLSGMPASSSSTSVVVSNGGSLETRTFASLASPSWSLTGNSGTNPSTNFIGTTDTAALEIRSNNTRVMRFEGHTADGPNIIGGASYNSVSTGSSDNVIGGGNHNAITGNASTIAGGVQNSSTGNNSFIGGGSGNQVFGGAWSVIVGGQSNSTGTNGSGFIGGGDFNTLGGYRAVICGGTSNSTGHYGFIGGGIGNHQDYSNNTIAGGDSNFSAGYFGFIGGGAQNQTGTYASVAGGTNNYASGNYSFIGGGSYNSMSYQTDYSTILGGDSNRIGDAVQYSTIAGGRMLKLSSNYSFGFNGDQSSTQTEVTNAENVAYFGNVDLWIGNVDGNARALRFYSPNTNHLFDTPNNQLYTSFKAQSQSANITYTLPASQGAASTVLSNDGSGNLSWVATMTNWVSAPASSSASGNPGDKAYDANYLYICVAANTWERVAISSW